MKGDRMHYMSSHSPKLFSCVRGTAFAMTLFFALLLPSCMSLQTEVKTTVSDEDIALITKQYELELVLLDGRCLSLHDAGLSTAIKYSETTKQDVAAEEKAVKTAAENFISRIQEELASPKMSRPLECRLLALEGRAYLITDKTSQATKCYNDAAAIGADDIQTLILSYRLEKDYSERLQKMNVSFTEEEAPLEIEQAISLYYIGQYAKAAASFDGAFAVLDKTYRTAYGQLRDTSWLLQNAVGNVSADTTAKILSADGMLLLLQSETNMVLSVNGGKILKAKDLASKMEAAGLLDSDIAKKVGDRHAVLFRSDVARAIWKVYIAKNAKANVDYAAQFAGQESPIGDVAVNTASFNAVAGCIENELMDLPDGVNFFPFKTISGPEFIAVLKKADK